MQIKEKLDFSFSIKDFKHIDEIFKSYLKDRKEIFSSLLETNYTNDDLKGYIHFFITYLFDGKKQHPYIYRIKHFLARNYEFYSIPEINDIINDLLFYFTFEIDDIILENFEEEEIKTLQTLEKLWNAFYSKVEQYPRIMLDSFEYDKINNCQLYYEKNTEDFVKTKIYEFIQIIDELFPKELMRLDYFIISDPEYIEFTAGERTFAYYLEDTVFFPSTIKEEDKGFFEFTLYHEFGHFIFELMSEELQSTWYDLYSMWIKKGLQLTREEGKNEVEELFADVFSLLIIGEKDSFVQYPSSIIMDYCKIIIEKEFGVEL